MQVKAFIALVGALVQLQAPAPPPATDPRRPPPPAQDANVSAEIVRTMREMGMMRALTGTPHEPCAMCHV